MKFSIQFLITALSKSSLHLSIFILSIVLSRYFTKDDYGTYLHIQLITNITVWAFLLGIPHGIYYFLPRSEKPKRYVLSVLIVILCIATLVSSIVFFFTDFLSEFLKNPRIEDLSYVLLLMILFKIPLTIFEPLMISAGRVKAFAKTEVFFNLSFFLTVLIPVIFDASMKDILICLVSIYSLHALIVLFYVFNISYTHKTDAELHEDYSLGDQVRYSLPLGLSMNVLEMSRYVDKVMVSNQSSAEDYAMYTRGAMEIPIIGIIANTLDNLHMPNFVKSYKENNISGLLDTWHSSVRLMAMFIYPCCLFLIVAAPLLIPALFSEKYIGSVIIFQIYSIGILSRISTFDIILRVIGNTKVIFWSALLSIFLNITLTYFFMQLWGLMGAPIATVISLMIMRLTYLIAITKHLDITLKEVFPWFALFKCLVAASMSSIPLIYMLEMSLGVWWNLLVMGIVFSVLYLVIVRSFNTLHDNDRESIRSILPSKLSWLV